MIFFSERKTGGIVSNQLIEQAIQSAKKLGILELKASTQYILNFKKQYKISLKVCTTDYQKSPEPFQD